MRSFYRISLVVLALLASSCSAEKPELSAPTSSVTTFEDLSTTDPESLAFADEPEVVDSFDLRVSVPEMTFVAPHAVDETNPANVLVTDLLTDGLTDRDPETGAIIPGLAESWSVSADRLTYTFELAAASFSDGNAIRASDVLASLDRVAAMGIQSLSGPNLAVVEGYDAVATGVAESISGVTAVDARTVEITLTEQYEPFTALLAGVSFGIFPVDIDTTGSLPLSSSRRYEPTSMWANGFRMEAVDDLERVSSIEVSVDPDGAMVAAGEVDFATGVSPDQFPDRFVRMTAPRSANAFYAINHAAAPLDQPVVRRAILQAIDRVQLRKDFFPIATVMKRFVPEPVPGGSEDACGQRCDLDVAAARQAIESEGAAGIPFTVDFFVDESDDDKEQRLAESLVASLRNIGLNATAKAHSVDVYGERIASGELGLFRFGSVSAALVADADLAAMFSTDGRDNVTSASIADFDEIIEIARSTVDPALRAALYADADVLLFEEAVVLPLVEFQHHLVLAETLESAGLEPDGSLDLLSIVPR